MWACQPSGCCSSSLQQQRPSSTCTNEPRPQPVQTLSSNSCGSATPATPAIYPAIRKATTTQNTCVPAPDLKEDHGDCLAAIAQSVFCSPVTSATAQGHMMNMLGITQARTFTEVSSSIHKSEGLLGKCEEHRDNKYEHDLHETHSRMLLRDSR